MSYQDWRCRDCGWVTVWEKAALAHAERMRHVVERIGCERQMCEEAVQVRVHDADELDEGQELVDVGWGHPISPATASVDRTSDAYVQGWREGFEKGEFYGRVRVEREAKQRRKEKQEQGIYKEGAGDAGR